MVDVAEDYPVRSSREWFTGRIFSVVSDEVGMPGGRYVRRDYTRHLGAVGVVALDEQERIVLTLYYFEELKLHEIADVLELTESRVSQIRAKALGKLRVELAGFRQRVA